MKLCKLAVVAMDKISRNILHDLDECFLNSGPLYFANLPPLNKKNKNNYDEFTVFYSFEDVCTETIKK